MLISGADSADIRTEGRIPILKTFLLSRKKGKRVALLPIPDNTKRVVTFKLLTEEHLSNPERRMRVIEDHPFLKAWGVTEATLENLLKKGTRERCRGMESLRKRPSGYAGTDNE